MDSARRDGFAFTWELGRQLKTASQNGKTYSFKYNPDGLRTQKTDGTVTTDFYWANGNMTYQYDGTNELYFRYDESGAPVSVNINGTDYYYVKNLQGDIITLLDGQGSCVVKYTYDAWGKVLEIEDSTETNIGTINPLRYRGYYYDSDLGFYYLQSRYYDPTLGRFLNADDIAYLGANETLISFNLFVYCDNNPVCNIDSCGNWYFSIEEYHYRAYIAGRGRISRSKQNKIALYRDQYSSNVRSLGGFYDYIHSQGDSRVSNLMFGRARIKKVGCELIAIYNVMKYIGRFHYFPDVINQCYINGLAFLAGHCGIMPKNIYKFFKASQVEFKTYSSFNKFISNLKKGTCGILSAWNHITGLTGLHTVMIVYKNGEYLIYNPATDYTKKSPIL